MENINLTPIFQAIIALLAAIVTYKLIPWIRSKTSETQYENLKTAARITVFAAEQVFKNGSNEDKLEYAVKELERFGFSLDFDELRSAVEQAVYEMKTDNKITDSYVKRNGAEEDTETDDDEITDFHLPPVEEWPFEMIIDFFNDNGIPHEGFTTKADYINYLSSVAEETAKE